MFCALPWLLSASMAAAPVPSEVQRCVDSGVMWLGDPQSFEAVEVERAGRTERAVQILDRHQGHTGYLLLFPRDCRLTVLALSPPEGRLSRTASLVPANGNLPTEAETAQLLAWAGYTPPDPEAPEQASADAAQRAGDWWWVDTWAAGDVSVTHRERPLELKWFDGAPGPQSAVWTELAGPRMRQWEVMGWNLFRWGGPWDDGRAAPGDLGPVLFPAVDGSNLLGLSVYDAEADAFAWVSSLVVAEVSATAVRRDRGLLWALGPSDGPAGWTLYAVDLEVGTLHALDFEPTGAAEAWRDAQLTDDGLLVSKTTELWPWQSLGEYLR